MVDYGEHAVTPAGNRYMTIFVIAGPRFVMIFPHKKKSDFDTLLDKAIAQAGSAPKTLRTDGALEYLDVDISASLLRRGIFKQTTCAHQQFQDGKVEKMVDTINSSVRTALTASNLPNKFWGYAAINAVDIYNHLPHSSLNFQTPWEAFKGTLPNVSMFKPFGCRATVFIGDQKHLLNHHKLSARGIPCIYLGLGFSRGYKGWVCFDPDTQRLYCTRHAVFDETYMPARVHEQRILGHYDPTPRTRIPTLLHGSLDKALTASDEVNSLPLVPTLEMLDNLADFSEEDLQEQPCGRLEHPEADVGLALNHEDATIYELQSASGGPSALASGGNSVAPSGGTSVAPSGGKSTTASGGTLSGGGANSGVSRSMLSAGENSHSDQVGSARYNSKDLHTYSQRDFRGAQVYNNPEVGAWLKLGTLLFLSCNDGDLVEWMIGHEISVIFKKRFWTGSSGNTTKRDLVAAVYDTLEHSDGSIPPEVKILVQEPDRHNHRNIKFSETEVLISMDPTVDGSRDIHRNCLREAIKDTFKVAREDPLCTLQHLLEAAIKQDLCSSTLADRDQVTMEDDEDDDDDEVMSEAGPSTAMPPPRPPDPPAPSAAPAATQAKQHKAKSGKTQKRAAAAAAAAQQDQPPAKRPRTPRSTTRHAHFAAMGIKRIVTETQKCFGMETNATRFDKMKRAKREFQMRNDTEGASFAALFATIQVCAMAASLGYDSQFLPLEPKNQREARKRPDADLWRAAEEKELATLWSKEAFELVSRPSEHEYDPLPLQFVYKLKVKDGDYENGLPKARCVAMGNLQYDYEYGDTYAPTARLWTVRTMAAIAAHEGLVMKKFDLTGAFLIADMDVPMHVQVPGYDLPKDKALLLKKALYGTKSSGALYAKEIAKWFKEYGFEPCSVDETLFRLTRMKGSKKCTLLVSLYVDDGACCTNDKALYQDFIKALGDKYELSDSGDLDWHLGIKVTQNTDEGTISLDQTAYIESVLKRFNMEAAKDKHTPLPPKTYLTTEDCPQTINKKEVKVYQQLLGSLMYVACGTRPDVAFAVNSCAQFMQNPGPSHLKAAKHILRYLRTTKDEKLTYSRQPTNMGNVLYAYVDADHAGNPDDRKSVGGYVLMLNGGAISWSSKKIKVVSISSFESEWYSASIASCEIAVVRRLLEEMDRKQVKPTVVFEDNAACIYAATNNKPFGQRAKHIDTRIFKLREYVESGDIELQKVTSQSNVADCLTKALPRETVEIARAVMFGRAV
jgi:hypothetical protein